MAELLSADGDFSTQAQPSFDTTIVIPVKNRERFIGTAIESALNQRVRPRQIIVVDDDSTDATVPVARRYSPAIRVIRLAGPSTGPARARNVAIRAAQSEYITFLDSDDVIAPDMLWHAAAAVRRTSAFGLLACNWSIVELDSAGSVTRTTENDASLVRSLPCDTVLPHTYLVPPGPCLSALLSSFFIKMNGTTVRRAVLHAVGLFDESFPCGSDFDMWVRLLKTRPLLFVDRPLQTVVRHSQNLSSAVATVSPAKELLTLGAYARILTREHEQAHERSEGALRSRIAAIHLTEAYWHRRQHEFGGAVSAVWRGVRFGAPIGQSGCELLKIAAAAALAVGTMAARPGSWSTSQSTIPATHADEPGPVAGTAASPSE